MFWWAPCCIPRIDEVWMCESSNPTTSKLQLGPSLWAIFNPKVKVSTMCVDTLKEKIFLWHTSKNQKAGFIQDHGDRCRDHGSGVLQWGTGWAQFQTQHAKAGIYSRGAEGVSGWKITKWRPQGEGEFWLKIPNRNLAEDRPGWFNVTWGLVGVEEPSQISSVGSSG